MTKIIGVLSIVLLIACNKDNTYPNESLIIGKWLTVEVTKNGVIDPAGVTRQSTVDFRKDGKMYFHQVNFLFYDTVKYEFVNNTTIRITKPWVSYPVNITYTIRLLDSAHFNLGLTSAQHSDIYFHRTVRQ